MKAIATRPRAADELAEIVAWLEGEQVGLGRRFEGVARRELERAAEFPHAFPIFYASLRRIIASPFKYGVVYAVELERIVVVAAIDLRREPRTILSRLREDY